MKTRYGWLVVLTIALLGLSGPVSGQTTFQKMLDALAGRKSTPASAEPVRESESRIMEILVELAWLGDPLTFPFYLEARVEGPNMQTHGNVPSPAVHEHAMKLAQMNTPLPVADGLKEDSRLKVRPTRMSPEQLQSVVRAALRESLPGLAKNLVTRCTADGQVVVLGNVENFERKLEVSRTLRRLHGCTVVTNLTKVAYDPDGKLARGILRPDAQTVSATTPVQPSITIQEPGANNVANNGPPGLPGGPQDVSNSEPPTAVPPAGAPNSVVTANGPKLTPAQIQKRIKDACPKAREVRVSQEKNGDIKVDVHVREESDINLVFDQIFSLPEMGAYPLRPSFIVDGPGKN